MEVAATGELENREFDRRKWGGTRKKDVRRMWEGVEEAAEE